jgi:hypothetical protein
VEPAPLGRRLVRYAMNFFKHLCRRLTDAPSPGSQPIVAEKRCQTEARVSGQQ